MIREGRSQDCYNYKFVKNDKKLEDFDTFINYDKNNEYKLLKTEIESLKTQVKYLKKMMIFNLFKSKKKFMEFF